MLLPSVSLLISLSLLNAASTVARESCEAVTDFQTDPSCVAPPMGQSPIYRGSGCCGWRKSSMCSCHLLERTRLEELLVLLATPDCWLAEACTVDQNAGRQAFGCLPILGDCVPERWETRHFFTLSELLQFRPLRMAGCSSTLEMEWVLVQWICPFIQFYF